ncbi:MAG TPA: hypothetical protein DCY74_04260, partial [Clostridiales bacterium]|nr:hypothetical protein [Clostridiales bacterium]
EEVGLTITFPMITDVFTRENAKRQSKILKWYGYTPQALLGEMKTKNRYLVAMDEEERFTMQVSMADSSRQDYAHISDWELLWQNAKTHPEHLYSQIYYHPQAKFVFNIDMYEDEPGIEQNIYEYTMVTVRDGKEICLSFQKACHGDLLLRVSHGMNDLVNMYTGYADIRTIMDNLVFHTADVTEQDIQIPASEFSYENKETGISFSLPAGWVETDRYAGDESLLLSLRDGNHPENEVFLLKIDVWEHLTEEEKSKLIRETISEKIFTRIRLSELMSAPVEHIKKTVYDQNTYYEYSGFSTPGLMGEALKKSTAFGLFPDKGYAYVFYYTGDSIQSSYQEYLSLLKTAHLTNQPDADFLTMDTGETNKLVSGISDDTTVGDNDEPRLAAKAKSVALVIAYVTLTLFPLLAALNRLFLRKQAYGNKTVLCLVCLFVFLCSFTFGFLVSLKIDVLLMAGIPFLLASGVLWLLSTGKHDPFSASFFSGGRMKTIICICLAFCLLHGVVMPISGRADFHTMDIKELGMSFVLPASLEYFTRDTCKDDPSNIAKYLMTVEQMQTRMKKKNAYVMGFDNHNYVYQNPFEHWYDVYVTMVKSKEKTCNLCTDSELLKANAGKQKKDRDWFDLWVDARVFATRELKFVRNTYLNVSRTYFAMEYTTVHDGKEIGFLVEITKNQKNGECLQLPLLEEETADYIESILRTITLQVPAPAHEKDIVAAPSHTYENIQTGVTLTMLPGWAKNKTDPEDPSLLLSLAHIEDPDCQIKVQCVDLWEQVSCDEKQGISREELSYEKVKGKWVAEKIGEQDAYFVRMAYGNNEYFVSDGTTARTEQNKTVVSDRLLCVWIHNGYAYVFRFGGGKESRYYVAFKDMLMHAVLPGQTGLTEKPADESLEKHVGESDNQPAGKINNITEEDSGHRVQNQEKKMLILMGSYVLLLLFPFICLLILLSRKNAFSKKTICLLLLIYTLLAIGCGTCVRLSDCERVLFGIVPIQYLCGIAFLSVLPKLRGKPCAQAISVENDSFDGKSNQLGDFQD